MNYGEFKKQFKNGDKVTCTIRGTVIKDAKINIEDGGGTYICQNYETGRTANDTLGYKYSYCLFLDNRDEESIDPYLEDLKPLFKSKAEDLEVGDIIIDKDGDESMILSINGLVIVMSHWCDFDRVGSQYTPNMFDYWVGDGKFRIKQEQKDVDTEELTMEQVCSELGRSIKIKK